MNKVICSFSLLLSLIAVSADVPATAQNGGTTTSSVLPHYRVVKGWPAKDALPGLNDAAAQGYRLILTGKMAVMRLDAQTPDVYRYMTVPDQGIFASFMNAVNQQGAFGYRWVENTHFMEKEPHPHNYEYETIEGMLTRTRQESRRGLSSRGFVPVGSFASRPIFMHEIDAAPASQPARSFQFVEMAPERKVMKEITRLAHQGYRYGGPDFPPTGSGIRMELCDEFCGGPFEYREVSVKDAEQVQHDLNEAAKEGFHLVASSFDWRPNLIERGIDQRPRFDYRVGNADELASAEQFVNAGDRDGFVPVAFAAHVGWSVHVFLILEKALKPE